MSATIDKAIAALETTRAQLAVVLVALLRYGTMGPLEVTSRFPQVARREDLVVGDLVAVLARGRYRVARVWNIGRTNLSAVYVTEREADGVERFGWVATPSNVTAPITACRMVEHVGEGEVAHADALVEVAPAGGVALEASQPCVVDGGADAVCAGMLPMDVEGFLF